MSHVRRAFAWCGALAVTLSFASAITPAAQAATPADDAAAASAVAWLKTQQLVDGGFEHAFPGFETRDATLAVAEQAQTGSTWSTSEALAAVQAVQAGGSGPTPLDFLEQDTAVVAAGGSAAKTIVLTTAPLGLDPTSFGSFGDAPGAPVDLVALMGGCAASSDVAINNLFYILLAEKLACGSISADGLANVRAQQQPDGSWAGFPGAQLDMDTTAVAVETLIAGGADGSDPAVRAALAFFAANQQADGAWQAFEGDDPNSTSLVAIAIAAAGYDPDSACWRDTVMPAAAGTAYVGPRAWLRSQQLPDGRIQSQNDGFGINTFATAQTVQGLLQSWLPITRAAAQSCELPPTPTVGTTTPVAGGPVTIAGGGFGPTTPLTIELHSTPVVLGTTTSDAFGNYSATVVIPADTAPGAHELVVSGLDPDGNPRSVSVAITVLAAGTPSAVPVTVAPRFTG